VINSRQPLGVVCEKKKSPCFAKEEEQNRGLLFSFLQRPIITKHRSYVPYLIRNITPFCWKIPAGGIEKDR
jgi:hypothetical protein